MQSFFEFSDPLASPNRAPGNSPVWPWVFSDARVPGVGPGTWPPATVRTASRNPGSSSGHKQRHWNREGREGSPNHQSSIISYHFQGPRIGGSGRVGCAHRSLLKPRRALRTRRKDDGLTQRRRAAEVLRNVIPAQAGIHPSLPRRPRSTRR